MMMQKMWPVCVLLVRCQYGLLLSVPAFMPGCWFMVYECCVLLGRSKSAGQVLGEGVTMALKYSGMFQRYVRV